MKHLRAGAILATLTAVLVVQLYLAATWENEEPVYTGPIVDSLLPTIPIHLLDPQEHVQLRDVLLRDGECSLVVIMDVNCGICQRMRIDWPSQFTLWEDSVGFPIKALWLVAEPFEETQEFFGTYHPGSVVRGQITSDPESAFRTLGVIGTPMMYLVDTRGRMRLGIAGNQFPSPQSVARVCQGE